MVYRKGTTKGKRSNWRGVLAFFGPAYLVSVGYMDPGNWATGIAGGSRFGYTLIWVLLMSNIIAIFLQTLCARLGVVRRRDLAQCNRETYPRGINFILYLLAETAIAATDLAEVLGMAVGLQLLFGLPLLWGVLISFLDTLLLLWLQKLGMRKIEIFIIGLIAVIGLCFLIEMFYAQPSIVEIGSGFIPSMPNSVALYISIGIIGATVMPHNLYLHSALVQTRKIKKDRFSIKKALKYNFWDSTIALNLAFLVNAAILILAASVFFKNGYHGVAELEDAYKLLSPLLGSKLAPVLFGVALIAAGQSSTVTGTLAGQVVMEGYLNLRISPALRRLITRLMAIIPAVIVILISGESSVGELLILSQVILSMQLAFAMIPLIHFVSDRQKMGEFVLSLWKQIVAWGITVVILALNVKLVFDETKGWVEQSNNIWDILLIVVFLGGMIYLLMVTIIYPLTEKSKHKADTLHTPVSKIPTVNIPDFKRIALAVDFTEADAMVLQYGLKMASPEATFILIHITESASPKLMDETAEDFETLEDRNTLKTYADMLSERGLKGKPVNGFGRRTKSIALICKEEAADVLIMGSHGHKGFQDFVFGETVNQVRHKIDIPIFIAQVSK